MGFPPLKKRHTIEHFSSAAEKASIPFMGIGDLIGNKRDAILAAAKHGAHRVRVFGSVARGDARADSDVDFLIQLDEERSLLDHVALVQDLEDLLGRKVDVITENAIHWYIRDRVLAEAVPL